MVQRDKGSNRPHSRSVVLAGALACVFHFVASASPYVGYGMAISIIIMLGVQALVDLPIWPNQKRPEHPTIFGVYWGLILGLIVPLLLARYMEEGFAGWMGLLSAS